MACMILLGTAVAPVATAGDSGIYIGASLGRIHGPDNGVLGTSDLPPLSGNIDDGDISWGATLGYRINRHFALELGYVDLGQLESNMSDPTGATEAQAAVSFAAKGATFAMLAGLPLGKWQPYLKAGLSFTSTELEYTGSVSGMSAGGRVEAHVEDALYGIGVNYEFNEQLRLLLDVTYVEAGQPGSSGEADFLNTSLGATWKF